MRSKTIPAGLSLSALILAGPAAAHVGDHAGDAAATFWHVVLDPVHLPLAVAAGLVVVVVLLRARRRLRKAESRGSVARRR